MAIEKTSATTLRVEARPYTTLPNAVVQGITNPDALAIWTYLQTMSSGWQVIAGHIQGHFDIGRDRYRKAMAFLKERGLISYVSTRNEAGHLLGQEIVVHHSPRVQESVPSEPSPRVQVSRQSVEPTVGESAPLIMDQGVEMDQNPHERDQDAPDGAVGQDEAPGQEDNPQPPVDKDVTLPDWIPPQAWRDFVQHRKQLKAPMTAKAKAMLLTKLGRHRDEGHDPIAMIEEAIVNGWKGVFPPKAPANGYRGKHTGLDAFSTEGMKDLGDGSFRL